MNNNVALQPPVWSWTFAFFFWTKGARDYRKDRKNYDDWYDNNFRKKSSLVLKNQMKMINGTGVLLIGLVTTLWTFLPQYIDLPDFLIWMKLGIKDVTWSNNWVGAIALAVVPSGVGTIIHNSPKIFPHRNMRIFANLIIKILPVLILIIIWYLPHTHKIWKKLRLLEKEDQVKSVSENVVSSNTT